MVFPQVDIAVSLAAIVVPKSHVLEIDVFSGLIVVPIDNSLAVA